MDSLRLSGFENSSPPSVSYTVGVIIGLMGVCASVCCLRTLNKGIVQICIQGTVFAEKGMPSLWERGSFNGRVECRERLRTGASGRARSIPQYFMQYRKGAFLCQGTRNKKKMFSP